MSIETWFAPNIGSTDFVDLFIRKGGWKESRERMDVFQFYVQNLTLESRPLIGDNSIEAFIDAQAFRFLKRQKIKVAVEGALYKEGQNTQSNLNRLVQAKANVEAAKGRCVTVALDEPFAAAKRDGFTHEWLVQFPLWVERLLEADFFDVTLIEPYPFFDLAEWKDTLVPYAEDACCTGLHIDVDLNHVADLHDGDMYPVELFHDIQNICDIGADVGLKVGLIITGNAATEHRRNYVTSQGYCDAGKHAVGLYATLENTTNLNRIIVQSWHRNGEDASIPKNTPDHLSLFDHAAFMFGENE